MGLLDSYIDPEQFQDSGGLLGRLLSLQGQQGQYQPGAGFAQPMPAPQMPARIPLPWPNLADSGQAPSVLQPLEQNPNPQYMALRPVLGDHNAMLAIVHPEFGRTLVAQALAGQTKTGNAAGANPSGNSQAGLGNEASSIADGQPPGLSQVGYFETPANANQAAGELQSIQQRNEDDAVSGRDYVSGVREGNIKRNEDGSLDVTNGTVVTLSYKDGRAKTVTVTNTDIAHIDKSTGEVVIQKSSLGKRI